MYATLLDEGQYLFSSLHGLDLALRELSRGLRPGGELILTPDNRANPAVAVARLLETLGERAKAWLFRGLQAWERLAGWPTFLTGYFLTVRARKAEAR